MIDLNKYVVGIKPKDKRAIYMDGNALNESTEHLKVLFIPESELDKIIEELEK